MDIKDKLEKLSLSQKNISKDYQEILNDIENSLDLNENEKLKKTLDEYKKNLTDLNTKYKTLYEENISIKTTLREQIIDEKLNIIKLSRNKLDTYFKKSIERNNNELVNLENEFNSKINNFINIVNKDITDQKEVFRIKINELSILFSEEIKKQQEKSNKLRSELNDEINNAYDKMSSEKVDDETMKKRSKQNKIEMKIGLNLINKIGILLIFLGTVFFISYNWKNINIYLKSTFSFLLGLLLLAGGEFFYRKSKDIFSKGLLGGGIAILYTSIFYSYFLLKIIDLNFALILCLIINILTIVLSIRYNSKTIISISLIGAFLPFISYIFTTGLSGNGYYVGMGYLFIINLIILIISFWKQWSFSNYLSFGFNIPALIYLVSKCDNEIIGIIYSAITFSMYLILVLSNPIARKQILKIPDLILLGLNTTISSVIIYLLFDKMAIQYLNGILALFFCLLYGGIGLLLNKISKDDFKSVGLFFITALTFAVLMIPFQFDTTWLSIGWLVEGVILILFGYKNKIKPLEVAGFILFGSCLFVFYFFDLFAGLINNKSDFFELKYFFITLGMVLLTLTYQWDFNKNIISIYSKIGKFYKALKYFTIINLYIFLSYISIYFYDTLIKEYLPTDLKLFYGIMIIALITAAYSFILTNFKFIIDKTTKIFGIILSILNDIVCFIVVLTINIFDIKKSNGENLTLIVSIISIIILIIYNILVLYNLRNLVLKFIKTKNKNFEFYPVCLGILLLGFITVFMVRQVNLENLSIYISIIYLIIAIISICYGFIRRYSYIRYFGLGLTIFACAKFFIFDLWGLSMTGKIISYFVFGVLLVAISFIYQYINNKLKIKDEGKNQDE